MYKKQQKAKIKKRKRIARLKAKQKQLLANQPTKKGKPLTS